MAKVTAADLKKHHYWILSGLAPLFALLAVLFLYTSVGAEVSKQAAENKKEVDAVKAVRPKGKGALDENNPEGYPKQKGKLDDQRKILWEKNFEKQKSMFQWPRNPQLQVLEASYPKFGATIPSNRGNEIEQIKKEEVYVAAYEGLQEAVKPTVFAGGSWRSVLRHVSAWGEPVPSDKRLWLALEDLWVQRGLLVPVNDINAAASVFKPVKPADAKAEDKLKKTFESRIWRLELEVPKQSTGGVRLVTCKLTNKTDRLQVLGQNNQMRLNLYLAPNAPPMLYRIQAPLVPAGLTVEVRLPTSEKDDPARVERKNSGKLLDTFANRQLHLIPPGVEPTEILKVEQLLDERNAPVRRIDDVQMGSRAKDARHFSAALQPPKWWPADAAPAAPAGGLGIPGASGPPGALGPGGDGDAAGGPMGRGGMMGMGGMGGMTGSGKGGGPAAVLDANKLRYIDVTDQVRRMPVAVVLIVDQMFVQDALAAYANSTLRFQVTQFHWTRFRGTLDGGSTLTGGGVPGGYPGGGMPAMGGPGGMPDGGDMGTAGPGGMAGGFPGMGGMGMGGLAGSASVSEEQVTSGLVELSLYGIVTLYEKFDTGAPATPAAPAAPAGETPTPAPAVPPGSPAAPATPPTGKQ